MLVVRIWEGLGNQMFQYAYARCLQEKTGEDVYLERRRIFKTSLPQENSNVERVCNLTKFNLNIKFINPKYLLKWNYLEQKNVFQKSRYFFAKKDIGDFVFLTDFSAIYSYHEELMNIKKNAYIMGHFLNKKYYELVKTYLIEEFTLKKKLNIPKQLEIVLQSRETVSIHIRRGDYLYVDYVQSICKEMNQRQYYRRAMEYINQKVKNPIFLIFSDDIEWVIKNFICPYEHIYISKLGYKDYEEMILMSYCKHNIIANSTFSFWGVWLNQYPKKEVIFPRHWMPTIIPKGWIQL